MLPEVKAAINRGRKEIDKRLLGVKDDESLNAFLDFRSKLIDARIPYLDRRFIEAAYVVGERAHAGQFRVSGEPYFRGHSVPVAETVLRWEIKDKVIIAAALLHDVIEDNEKYRRTGSYAATKRWTEALFRKALEKEKSEDVIKKLQQKHAKAKFRRDFQDRFWLFPGEVGKVAALVHSVSEQKMEDKQAQTNQLNMSVLDGKMPAWILKFADRLHNFSTMDAMPREKQAQKVLDTLPLVKLFAKVAEVHEEARIDLKKLIEYLIQYAPDDERQRITDDLAEFNQEEIAYNRFDNGTN